MATATVVLKNHNADSVMVAGLTFANGDNNIDSDVLLLLAKLGLISSAQYPFFTFDLSAMEP